MQAARMVERVRQEVAIHSRLKHPSVLELYTFFEDANYVYLVLELCHNGELQRYFKNTNKVRYHHIQRVPILLPTIVISRTMRYNLG